MTLADEYRAWLADPWRILALEWEEVEEALPEADLDAWDQARSDLDIGDWNPGTSAFFDWLGEDQNRFGSIHSTKWMDILSSGVWATRVVEALKPDAAVLELGCHGGYWCSWLAARGDRRVVGMDVSGAAIAFGRKLLPVRRGFELVEADIRTYVPDEAFDCIVSLQTLIYLSRSDDFESHLRHIASMMRPDGLLISVDQYQRDRLAETGDAFLNAGFTVMAQGLAGGLGADGEWGAYPGIVFRRAAVPSGPHLAEVFDLVTQEWEQDFAPFANSGHPDWTTRNLAYFWESGASPFKLV